MCFGFSSVWMIAIPDRVANFSLRACAFDPSVAPRADFANTNSLNLPNLFGKSKLVDRKVLCSCFGGPVRHRFATGFHLPQWGKQTPGKARQAALQQGKVAFFLRMIFCFNLSPEIFIPGHTEPGSGGPLAAGRCSSYCRSPRVFTRGYCCSTASRSGVFRPRTTGTGYLDGGLGCEAFGAGATHGWAAG